MSIAEKKKAKFEKVTENYEVNVHPQTNRLYHIEISKESYCQIFRNSEAGESSVQHLEYTPYARHIVGFLFIRSGRRRIW